MMANPSSTALDNTSPDYSGGYLLLLSVTVFLGLRLPDLLDGRASAFDVVMLLIWLGLLLCPLFAEISIFGLNPDDPR